MPVYRTPREWLHAGNGPAWAGAARAGAFAVPATGGVFERHHHDDHEYWFITSGRGKAVIGAERVYLRPGDIVLTRAGDEHDIVEIYEPLAGFFLETGQPAGGRSGHLYRGDPAAARHAVPLRPLPPDFPVGEH
ncbi:cupin domain-containing protein [Streptomyces pathocidini]|uniref:Cupin domain-containing protein n=1 Tax=Streptomyces pathocidini TaxID=1650571 RepID=A0ABW7UKL0_9ACTN|nr:cupin domain-containing protein [Streptomyces pathocidini]